MFAEGGPTPQMHTLALLAQGLCSSIFGQVLGILSLSGSQCVKALIVLAFAAVGLICFLLWRFSVHS